MGREVGARTLVRIGQDPRLPVMARSGRRPSRLAPWWLRKAVEPTAPATTSPLSGIRRLTAVSAARALAGLERGGDKSAGPAGGRAACGERSEPP